MYFSRGNPFENGKSRATEIGHFLSHERASRAGAAGGNRHPGSENEGLSKTKIVVCDPVNFDDLKVEEGDRRALRAVAAKLMEPIAESIEKYS